MFGKADVNGDGSLSDKELHYATFILDTDIASGRFLEKSLATELIGGLDANGDGKLDKEEVCGSLAWGTSSEGFSRKSTGWVGQR